MVHARVASGDFLRDLRRGVLQGAREHAAHRRRVQAARRDHGPQVHREADGATPSACRRRAEGWLYRAPERYGLVRAPEWLRQSRTTQPLLDLRRAGPRCCRDFEVGSVGLSTGTSRSRDSMPTAPSRIWKRSAAGARAPPISSLTEFFPTYESTRSGQRRCQCEQRVDRRTRSISREISAVVGRDTSWISRAHSRDATRASWLRRTRCAAWSVGDLAGASRHQPATRDECARRPRSKAAAPSDRPTSRAIARRPSQRSIARRALCAATSRD